MNSLVVLLILSVSTVCLTEETEKKQQKFGPKEAKKLLESQDKLREKVREYIKLEEERIAELKKYEPIWDQESVQHILR